MKKLPHALLLSGLLFLYSGCKKASVDPPGGQGYDVAYTDKTILIDNPGVIVSDNEETQVVTLKKDGFSEQPKPGQVILVSGEIMKKVKKVSSSGNNYVIETEDAALTEVIKDGTLEWSITPEWQNASSLRIGGDEVMGTQGFHSGVIEHTFNSEGVQHRIRIEPHTAWGELNACTFTFEMIKESGGRPSSRFYAKGTARLPEQRTKIGISGSKLETFRSNMKGISVDLEMEMAAAGGSSSAHNFKIPKVALSIPIKAIPGPLGPIPIPIPVTVDVGIHFVSQISISGNSSAQASTRCSISADGGFEFKGTEVATTGEFGKSEITDGTFDSAAGLGIPVDLQYGVAFPRVSLNIAKQEVAYIHTAFTTGSSLSWGPLCKQGYSKTSVEGGYGLKALGIELIKSANTVFAESKKEAKGENCD